MEPPAEDTASTAPAYCGLNPIIFMRGMVIEPVAVTLATVLPDTVPIIALDITATLAGPPVYPPATENASLIKYFKAPLA